MSKEAEDAQRTDTVARTAAKWGDVAGVFSRMAKLEPDLLLVPYGYAAQEQSWPGHGRELERVVTNAAGAVAAPAIGTNVIGAITHGPWAGRTYAGHSVAADRTGRILATGRDFDREIMVVTVPL